MTEFKRTWEKVTAWIGNVCMILVTLLVSWVAFSGILDKASNDAVFRKEMEAKISELNANVSFEDIVTLMRGGAMILSVGLIVLLVLALVATFIMNKFRIASGVIFILVAVVIGLFTLGGFFPIYGAYGIAGILLLVRANPNQDNKKDGGDTIEYM